MFVLMEVHFGGQSVSEVLDEAWSREVFVPMNIEQELISSVREAMLNLKYI